MTAYDAYLAKIAASPVELLDRAHAAGQILGGAGDVLRRNWSQVGRAGQNLSELAGKHAPTVDRGLEALARTVGAADAAVSGVERTSQGLQSAAKGTHALRDLVRDYRKLRGKTQPNPWVVGGLSAAGGALLGSALSNSNGGY